MTGPLVRLRAVLRGKTFRKDEVEKDDVHGGQGRGEIKGRTIGDAAHDSTDHRAKSEPEAKSGADHAHRARAIFRGADVGNVGLRVEILPPVTPSMMRAANKERERSRPAHEEKSNRGAGKANDQDRAAAEAIGKLAQDRRKDNLHPGINASEPADRDRVWRGNAPRKAEAPG